MNPIAHILNRSVAAPFYRQHAGVFLFLFLLLIGIQTSFYNAVETHYYILLGILTSVKFFFAALTAWLIYGLKIFFFFTGCLKKTSYDFLFLLNTQKKIERFRYLLHLNITLWMPILGYGVFLLFVACREHLFLKGILVLSVICLLLLACTFFFYMVLQKEKAMQQVTTGLFAWLRLPNTIFGFVVRFVFRKQFIALFVLKLLSFVCLFFFVRTEARVFEQRMLWVLYLTCLAGHSIIIYRNFHFIETELSFCRNLPLRGVFMLLSLLGVYTVLLLPEMWALRGLIIYQGHGTDYFWMIISGPLLLLLLHSLLYSEDMKMEEFLKLIFGIWIVFLFFSLSPNHWIIPAICFVFSAIIFHISYRGYEKDMEIKE
jgi:hypothetical protein